jgi:hypothetical protein
MDVLKHISQMIASIAAFLISNPLEGRYLRLQISRLNPQGDLTFSFAPKIYAEGESYTPSSWQTAG